MNSLDVYEYMDIYMFFQNTVTESYFQHSKTKHGFNSMKCNLDSVLLLLFSSLINSTFTTKSFSTVMVNSTIQLIAGA